MWLSATENRAEQSAIGLFEEINEIIIISIERFSDWLKSVNGYFRRLMFAPAPADLTFYFNGYKVMDWMQLEFPLDESSHDSSHH